MTGRERDRERVCERERVCVRERARERETEFDFFSQLLLQGQDKNEGLIVKSLLSIKTQRQKVEREKKKMKLTKFLC